MRRAFGVSKFQSLLVAGSFTVLANYIVRLSDSVIAGNLLGPDALAGINLAGPCLSAISFLAGLIATGVATEYSIAMGRCDQRRARQFFVQGLWSVLLFGGILAALIGFGREAFLGFFGASAEITAHARGYLSWIWPLALVDGVQMLLVSLAYADGDSRLCMLAYAEIFVGNFVTSVVAVKLGFGCAGCAVGSVVAETLAILIMSVHFFRKTNTLKLVAHFRLTDSFRIFAASFGDAAAFLCDGLLFFFLNKFVIMTVGSHLLPVVGVATALWGFLEFFNGVGVAIQPIVTVYYGEGNTKAIGSVMASAMRVSLVEGLAFMALFGLFPRLVTGLVGISDPELVWQSVTAIRWMCGGFVALAFAGLFNSYYMFVEKPVLAGVITFLCYLVMPVAAVAAGALVGVEGIWAGIGAGPFLGLAVTSLIILSTSGVSMFPLLLPRDREDKLHVFDLQLTDREIVETSRKIGTVPGVPMKAALMAEEVFMAVKDRAGGKLVRGEATLDLNDGVRLTLRDDGEIFDITDADQSISSLRSYLVASMMISNDGKQNLITTGFNRNVFSF